MIPALGVVRFALGELELRNPETPKILYFFGSLRER